MSVSLLLFLSGAALADARHGPHWPPIPVVPRAGVSNSLNLVGTTRVSEGKTSPVPQPASRIRLSTGLTVIAAQIRRTMMMRASSIGDFFFGPRTGLLGVACIDSACIEIENRKRKMMRRFGPVAADRGEVRNAMAGERGYQAGKPGAGFSLSLQRFVCRGSAHFQ